MRDPFWKPKRLLEYQTAIPKARMHWRRQGTACRRGDAYYSTTDKRLVNCLICLRLIEKAEKMEATG